MLTLPGQRRRAEELAEVLDGRSDASASVEVTSLATLATALRELPTPEPDAEFRAALRKRLVAVASFPAPEPEAPATVADRLRTRRTAGELRRPQRRMRAAGVVLAGATALAGVGYGASHSLPGDPLYRIKRVAEQLQYAAAGSAYERGTAELGFARARMHELHALSTRPHSSATRMLGLLHDMDTETAKGTQLLDQSFAQDPRPAPLQTLVAFTGRQERDLSAVLPLLPAPAQAQARTSLTLLEQIDQRTTQLLDAACASDACAPGAAAAAIKHLGLLPSGGVPGSATAAGSVPGVPTVASSGAVPTPAPASSSGNGTLTGGTSGTTTGGAGSGMIGGAVGGIGSAVGGSVGSVGTGVGGVASSAIGAATSAIGGVGNILTGSPSPTASHSKTSSPAPSPSICASPLILVGGLCVTPPALP